MSEGSGMMVEKGGRISLWELELFFNGDETGFNDRISVKIERVLCS